MKKIVILSALILSVFSLNAQTAEDALRYSQNFYEGSARNMAMGSAFSVLGADFSAASINPAGLGLFRSYEFSLSPELGFRSAESVYNNTYGTDDKTVFNLSGFGYVMTKKLFPAGRNGWKFVQFSFGMNRLNNFNTRLNMAGPNMYNSKMDVYLSIADGVPYTDIENDPYGNYAFDLKPAWDLYLIDTIPGYTDRYYSPVPPGGILQQEQITTRGSINEYSFSFSGNYNDFLYLGATIGMPYVRYFSTSLYSETDIADTISTFNKWSIKQDIQTTGWGINLKLGAIIRPLPWLRVGAAFHTPTYYYSLRDYWYTSTYADLPGITPSYSNSPTGNFNYNLMTPLKVIGSLGFTIMKRGAVAVEYEYTDYGMARFSAPGTSYGTVNGDIRNYYGNGNNIRAGAEWRFGPLSLRGGYACYGTPYKNNFNDGKRQLFSGGIGYSSNIFRIDFAYVHSVWKEDYYMYYFENVNPVNNKYKTNKFVATIKFRF